MFFGIAQMMYERPKNLVILKKRGTIFFISECSEKNKLEKRRNHLKEECFLQNKNCKINPKMSRLFS